MSKRGVLLAASLILTLAVWGTVGAQEPYVVGFSAALTGPGSGTYAPIKDAFDVYFNEVNAKGGINGHPVKIIFEDNAAQPSKAASDAKKFVTQDKVVLMLNASLSSTYAPMVQVAQQAKVPIFFAAARLTGIVATLLPVARAVIAVGRIARQNAVHPFRPPAQRT